MYGAAAIHFNHRDCGQDQNESKGTVQICNAMPCSHAAATWQEFSFALMQPGVAAYSTNLFSCEFSRLYPLPGLRVCDPRESLKVCGRRVKVERPNVPLPYTEVLIQPFGPNGLPVNLTNFHA